MSVAYKIGMGYDIHRLVKGRRLVLGGVTVPYAKGLTGHSDADCLLHAICDALLGAIGEGDIGEHFPNTDKRYKNISSLVFLKKVKSLVGSRGFKIGNIDSVILAEKPHLKNFKPKMRATIAGALGIPVAHVNVKATTQEGVGFGSVKEAIAAYAIALLVKSIKE